MRSWRHVHRLALSLTVAALVAGCLSGTGDDGSSGPGGRSPGGEDGTPGSGDGTQTSPDGLLAGVVVWLDLAPQSPAGVFPRGAVFDRLADRDCAGADEALRSSGGLSGSDLQRLYEGAVAACLAAIDGRTEEWSTAEAALGEVTGDYSVCIDRAVYRLLADLVAAHRSDPDGRVEISRESSGAGMDCPTITALRPASGQAPVDVRLEGDNLGHVVYRLTYDTAEEGPVHEDSPQGWTSADPVTIEPRGGARRVCVAVAPVDAPTWWVSGKWFEIESAPTGGGPTDEASPTDGESPTDEASPTDAESPPDGASPPGGESPTDGGSPTEDVSPPDGDGTTDGEPAERAAAPAPPTCP